MKKIIINIIIIIITFIKRYKVRSYKDACSFLVNHGSCLTCLWIRDVDTLVWTSIMRWRRRCVTTSTTSTSSDCLTSSSSMSSAMNVPDRPTPALQCTSSGPIATSHSARTLRLNANSGYTSSGTLLSLQRTKCKWLIVLSVQPYANQPQPNKTDWLRLKNIH